MKSKVSIALVVICMALGCVVLFNQNVMGKQSETQKDTALEKPSKIKDLPYRDDTVAINTGEAVRYENEVQHSVGSDFWMEYDSTAFDEECSSLYFDPGSVERNECGGDRALRTCILRPRKTGEFQVRAIHDFRGDTEMVFTYVVVVNESPANQ